MHLAELRSALRERLLLLCIVSCLVGCHPRHSNSARPIVEYRQSLEELLGEVQSVALSPDGKTLACSFLGKGGHARPESSSLPSSDDLDSALQQPGAFCPEMPWSRV